MEETLKQKNKKLLETAIKFLQDPRVKNESVELKTTFLKSKGLSDQLIKTALDRVQSGKDESKGQEPTQGETSSLEQELEKRIGRAQITNFLTLRGLELTKLKPEVMQLKCVYSFEFVHKKRFLWFSINLSIIIFKIVSGVLRKSICRAFQNWTCSFSATIHSKN